ncbi:MAG: DUF2461 domain-containing protein [Pyrinomonadaceae bacterium]|nr:DUF2461 domain-containing protein [Pyrinomonadaceae bacterium]
MSKIEPSVFKFLSELEKNNDRDWFTANKKRFESEAKEPFLNFLEDLRTRLAKSEPELSKIPVKKMMFRIYRDIRFSKDKSPYKTHLTALISPEGTKNKTFPAHYLHISADECFLAGGAYFIENADVLYRVRRFVFDNSERFEKLINAGSFKENFGEMQGEKHKRIPPEFKEFHERQPLIANKQFYWSANLSPKNLQKDGAAELIVEKIQAAAEIRKFFIEALDE